MFLLLHRVYTESFIISNRSLISKEDVFIDNQSATTRRSEPKKGYER